MHQSEDVPAIATEEQIDVPRETPRREPMRLDEIPIEDVLTAKNWLLQSTEGADDSSPLVIEAVEFGTSDQGLFSAMIKFGDGSIHPGLVVKSFADGGDEVDLYIHTGFGWMNLHEKGFMRAVKKYSHEIFPFDYYLGSPWKAGDPPKPDMDSPHRRVFPGMVSTFRESNGK